LLQPTVAGAPHERWSIDLTGPHPRSKKGNVYIFTCIDVFSKWAEAYPIPNKEAATVAKVFMENIVCKFGVPLSILSDQGKEVNGLIWHELCRLLDVEKLHTTAYKPSTNAQIERFHKTLNAMIGRIISDKQTEWDELLPYVMAAYRASPHNSTHYSPNMLIFGHENRAPLDIVLGIPEPESSHRSYDVFVEDVQSKLKAAYDLVRTELQTAANRNKRYYDMSVRPAKFEAGDWVFYYNPRRFIGKSEKWSRKYTGPMLVLKKLGPVNYLLQKSAKALPFVSHVDKLKRCYSKPSTVLTADKPVQGSERLEVECNDLAGEEGAGSEAGSGQSTVGQPVGSRPRRVIRLPARYQV
jgi:transposase InsO family protein